MCDWQPEISEINSPVEGKVVYLIIYRVWKRSQVVSQISEPSTACCSKFFDGQKLQNFPCAGNSPSLVISGTPFAILLSYQL